MRFWILGLMIIAPPTAFSVEDSRGAFGEEVGAGLFTTSQYWRLKSRELGAGDRSQQLAEGALSPQGVNAIRRLFEESVLSAMIVQGESPVVAEKGGFAEFDGGLIFHEQPHFAKKGRCAAVERAGSFEGLLELYSLYPEEMLVLDPGAALKRILLNPRIQAERKAAAVTKIVAGLVASSASTYLAPRGDLKKSLREEEWRGRFLGAWHTHPPEYGPNGWAPGEMSPSGNDLSAAAEGLEFLLVFQADGFDLIDLFALKGAPIHDVSRVRRLPYRSEDWRCRFDALHRVFGSAPFAAIRASACR